MNLKNVNNSLLLKGQDSFGAVLPLFVFLLPFSALLSHSHLAAGLWVVGALLLVRPALPIRFSARERVFLLFLLCSLSGAVLPLSRARSVLSALLRLVFFLPIFASSARRAIKTGLLFAGGALGALSLLSLALGYGKTGYTDPTLAGELARAAPVFGNPNVLAAFLLPPTLLSLGEMLFPSQDGTRRIFSGAVFLLGAGGICATFSRGALLALCLGVALLAVWRMGAWRAALLFFSSLPLLLLLLPDTLCARLSSVLSPDSSVLYRLSLWRSVLRLPLRSLLFGGGEGKEAMMALLSPVLASGLLHIEHTHSLFLHVLVADGLVGLLFFLVFCALSLWKSRRAGAVSAVLALLCYGIFDDPLYSGQTEVIFWLSFGLL
ncbi:MAG: O-antigen ligase family protein [Clostridia bacterium]|nr:O-antigen ligase family protein [Clostridia bacterium]